MLILLKVAAVHCGTNGDNPIDNTPWRRNSIKPGGTGHGGSAGGLLAGVGKAKESPSATAATERNEQEPTQDDISDAVQRRAVSGVPAAFWTGRFHWLHIDSRFRRCFLSGGFPRYFSG